MSGRVSGPCQLKSKFIYLLTIIVTSMALSACTGNDFHSDSISQSGSQIEELSIDSDLNLTGYISQSERYQPVSVSEDYFYFQTLFLDRGDLYPTKALYRSSLKDQKTECVQKFDHNSDFRLWDLIFLDKASLASSVEYNSEINKLYFCIYFDQEIIYKSAIGSVLDAPDFQIVKGKVYCLLNSLNSDGTLTPSMITISSSGQIEENNLCSLTGFKADHPQLLRLTNSANYSDILSFSLRNQENKTLFWMTPEGNFESADLLKETRLIYPVTDGFIFLNLPDQSDQISCIFLDSGTRSETSLDVEDFPLKNFVPLPKNQCH